MTLPSVVEAKPALRHQALRRRAEAAARLGATAGEALAARAGALGDVGGRIVGGYWPLTGEIDPRPLMLALAAAGARIGLPVVVAAGQPLAFRLWTPDTVLERGRHGTVHPPSSAEPLVPGLLLVPLLAFDAKGFRLGHGGGYYDRTLARLRQDGGVVAVGLAFSAQEVPAVPADPWDERLDMIFTERGLMPVEGA